MLSCRFYIIGLHLLILSRLTHAVVLLTANIEDVKKIARKFVPEPLAEQIAEFIAKIGENTAPNVSEENEKNAHDVQDISDNEVDQSNDYTKASKQILSSKRFRMQTRRTTKKIEMDVDQNDPDPYTTAPEGNSLFNKEDTSTSDISSEWETSKKPLDTFKYKQNPSVKKKGERHEIKTTPKNTHLGIEIIDRLKKEHTTYQKKKKERQKNWSLQPSEEDIGQRQQLKGEQETNQTPKIQITWMKPSKQDGSKNEPTRQHNEYKQQYQLKYKNPLRQNEEKTEAPNENVSSQNAFKFQKIYKPEIVYQDTPIIDPRLYSMDDNRDVQKPQTKNQAKEDSSAKQPVYENKQMYDNRDLQQPQTNKEAKEDSLEKQPVYEDKQIYDNQDVQQPQTINEAKDDSSEKQPKYENQPRQHYKQKLQQSPDQMLPQVMHQKGQKQNYWLKKMIVKKPSPNKPNLQQVKIDKVKQPADIQKYGIPSTNEDYDVPPIEYNIKKPIVEENQRPPIIENEDRINYKQPIANEEVIPTTVGYTEIKFDQTAMLFRTRPTNNEIVHAQKIANDILSDGDTIILQSPRPTIVIDIQKVNAFNIERSRETTPSAPERNEFDDYVIPTQHRTDFLATSGPVVLRKMPIKQSLWDKKILPQSLEDNPNK